jgi:hypothetical protein
MILEFEKLIVSKVFKSPIHSFPFHTIKDMIEVLRVGYYKDPQTTQNTLTLSQDELITANGIRTDLKNEIDWQRHDERKLHQLKKSRLYVAHPTLSETNLQKVLTDADPFIQRLYYIYEKLKIQYIIIVKKRPCN